MKKLFLLALVAVFAGCTKSDSTNSKLTTPPSSKFADAISLGSTAEYDGLDKDTKGLVDLINAAVRGLQGIREYNVSGYPSQTATITYSTDRASTRSLFAGSIVLAPAETDAVASDATASAEHGSCHVCGLSSAMSSIKKVTKYMNDNHLTEIDVHVKLAGDCVDITY
jgi:hypothetical protein